MEIYTVHKLSAKKKEVFLKQGGGRVCKETGKGGGGGSKKHYWE